jgi:hypothetical protein
MPRLFSMWKHNTTPFRSRRSAAMALVILALEMQAVGWSQQLPSATSAAASSDTPLRPAIRSKWFSAYRAPTINPSPTQNSDLVSSLIHDGKLSLTLQDAITLAIENNFDVELQRYDRSFAWTETLRAKGGGLLRGIPTTVAELPSGEGGPGEPLLTTVGGYSPVLQLPSSAADLATITETQSDLSMPAWRLPMNLSSTKATWRRHSLPR